MVVSRTDVGVSLAGLGAALVHHAWLGEVAPGAATPRADARSTALELASGERDVMVSDVVTFSAWRGVLSQNAANQLDGVHA